MAVLQLIAATHVQQCLLQKNARKIVKVSYNCWSYGDNESHRFCSGSPSPL